MFDLNISGKKHEKQPEERRSRRAFDGMSIVLRSRYHGQKLETGKIDEKIQTFVRSKVQGVLDADQSKNKAEAFEKLKNNFERLCSDTEELLGSVDIKFT